MPEISLSARPAAAFAALLERAVIEPGIISAAYHQFHTYSVSSQLLAWMQCIPARSPAGPARHVRSLEGAGTAGAEGERAISLWMPVTVRRAGRGSAAAEDDLQVFTRFVYRPNWFVLAQTDGADVPAVQIPSWDREAALTALNVTEIPFKAFDGNAMGFARQRSIAISPLNPLPHKTRFHELAHVLLGHTAEGEQSDGELTPRNLQECEAEAVALVCCAALDLPGIEESRGYIQHWRGHGNPIPERSAQRRAIARTGEPFLGAAHAVANWDDYETGPLRRRPSRVPLLVAGFAPISLDAARSLATRGPRGLAAIVESPASAPVQSGMKDICSITPGLWGIAPTSLVAVRDRPNSES